MTKLLRVFFMFLYFTLTMKSPTFALAANSTSTLAPSISKSAILSQVRKIHSNEDYLSRIFGGTLVKSWEPLSHKVIFIKAILDEKKAVTEPGTTITQSRKNCSGVLIRPTVVLTAAHCFAPEALRHEVVFSINPDQLNEVEQSLLPSNEGSSLNSLVIDRVYLSEVDPELAVDLILLKLDKPAPYPYQPIKMEGIAQSHPQGILIRLAGYGRSEVVTSNVQIPYVDGRSLVHLSSNRNAIPLLRSVELRSSPLSYEDREIIFDQRQGKGVCSGDSGGPVFIYKNGEFVVIGINSYVFSNESEIKPVDPCQSWGAAVLLSPYLLTIEKAVAKLGRF